MNTAPSETAPDGTPSTGTGYASTTTDAAARARMPASIASVGSDVARLTTAVARRAIPPRRNRAYKWREPEGSDFPPAVPLRLRSS